jgi:hypothetical protein
MGGFGVAVLRVVAGDYTVWQGVSTASNLP